jgi:hypothetical protein
MDEGMLNCKLIAIFTTLKWMYQPTLIICMVRQGFLLPYSGDFNTDVLRAYDAIALWE